MYLAGHSVSAASFAMPDECLLIDGRYVEADDILNLEVGAER